MTLREDTATELIVEWSSGLGASDIPAEVRDAASYHILDAIGTALAARRYKMASAVLAVAQQFELPREATVIGGSSLISSPFAALSNGALIHSLDYDDTHADALVHPSAVVFPTALAVGESCVSDGASLMTAYVAGVEVMVRLGTVVRNGFHSKGFHATSICGVFAAALVASRLAGLNPAETVSALGLAGSQAAGSLEFLATGADTKILHPGLAAMQGILCARLAGAGAVGPSSILEGRYGLYASYLGVDVSVAALVDGLGTTWELPAVAVKLYPACQLSHASLDALRAVLGEIGAATSVEKITFEVPSDAVPIVCEPAAAKRSPRSSYEAKFSLAWCAALLLCDRVLGIDSFDADQLNRQDVADVAARIDYKVRKTSLAAAASPGVVEVVLKDGRHVTYEHDLSSARSKHGLDTSAVLAKFQSNVGDAAIASRLEDSVAGLWSAPNLIDISHQLTSTN